MYTRLLVHCRTEKARMWNKSGKWKALSLNIHDHVRNVLPTKSHPVGHTCFRVIIHVHGCTEPDLLMHALIGFECVQTHTHTLKTMWPSLRKGQQQTTKGVIKQREREIRASTVIWNYETWDVLISSLCPNKLLFKMEFLLILAMFSSAWTQTQSVATPIPHRTPIGI